ncbi:hypothetical protein HBI56_123470 [Parastagonospora nodorum]|nr:hypothetical protein HBI10_148950 [Parastagonospora nodorum]KAH4017247.1 hypothetical protein HBI09_198730 [Parastagonospora nodorum]KAH4020095.1 hypothetical protein HBI13_122090 [Parastagonospora nodorum]KAH4076693.1 hypothetical protein HBH50_009140 [Parastagonospora nodorum]KAH4095823.1 hypothetical protein HBH48_048610 [Parastagonospora nodorum]
MDNTQYLFQQLEQTKQNFWNSHAHLSENERQELWSQATALPPNNAFGSSNASTAQQTPRSMPSTSNLTHLPTMDYGYSTPRMSPSMSTATDANGLQRSMSDWQSMSRESNDYTFYSDASMRQQQALQSIPEHAGYTNQSLTEWSPRDYVSNCIEPESSFPLSSSFPQHSQQLQVLTPSLQWGSSSEGSTTPNTPSTALMTPITHASNSMSRQSSCNSSFLGDTSMLRIQSDSSCMLPILPEDGVSLFPFDVESKPVTDVNASFFPSFGGSATEAFLPSTQSASPASAPRAFASSENTPYLGEDMSRSASTSSSEGNVSDGSMPSSNYSRQSRRDRDIALAATRTIAPKAIERDYQTESASSNAQMARIKSADGSSKTVGVLTKTPYVRPQHPKIHCPHCPEKPCFRGTHELDRHIARAHASRRKGYICVDYSADKKFLANCKHCRNKKVYGAYYNAAAHLRRAHFHPRKRGRKGKNDEKRGGIGGGDHPAMDYLKQHWIKEVEVDNNTCSSPGSASDDAADANDNSYEQNFDINASAPFPSQPPMPTSMTSQVQLDPSQFIDGYGLSMNASETIMYDANTYDNNTFVAYDPNVAATTDMSNFQFDAYM